MKRQYTSMQEELEARKAAGEFGNMAEYDRRYRRDDPSRYRRIENLKADIRNAGESSSARKTGRTPRARVSGAEDPLAKKLEQLGQAGRSRQRLHETVARKRPAKSRNSGGIVVLLTTLIIFLVAIGIGLSIFRMVRDHNAYYEPSYYDPEEAVVLDENSSYYDAIDFILETADSNVDDDTLNKWAESEAYQEISAFMDETGNYAYWRVSGGMLFLNVWYDRADHAGAEDAIFEMYENVRGRMDDQGIDAPCALIVTDYETNEVLLVCLDGEMWFGRDEFASY
ncbi:MAG: hypothetical protein IJH75_03480 [Mogibacterium sp.]|nr:hypothetical protein [Mogibacterium sp.]